MFGAQHTGTVKSGEQAIPGAVVTALQGERKVATSTDENGSYLLDLSPGDWTISVTMFGFQSAGKPLSQTDQPSTFEWVLDFAPAKPVPPGASKEPFPPVRLNPTATQDAVEPPHPTPLSASEEPVPTESFVVSGSISQGLQSPKEEDLSYVARLFDAEKAAAQAAQTGQPGQPGAPSGARSGAAPPGFQPRAAAAGTESGAATGKAAKGAAYLSKMSADRRALLMKKAGKAKSRYESGRTFGNKRKRGPGIRGMAFYSAGNSALDARPYSITGFTYNKPEYAQNRFGVNLGGPMVIPRILNLSRTYFSFNYNGTKSRNPYNGFGTVPSPNERAGDFSQSRVRGPVTVYDPQSGAPFPENRIPGNRMHTASAGLLPYIPLPNRPGLVQNYQFVTANNRETNELGARINQSLSQKNRISGGYSWQTRAGDNPNLLGFIGNNDGTGYTVDIGWSFTLGPRKVHDLRVRVNRDRNATLPFFAFKEDVATRLNIIGPSSNPVNWGPPNLNFTNFADLNDASYVLRRNQNVSLIDSVSIVQKGHTIGAGIEFRWAQINTNTDQNARGSFTFSGLLSSGLDGRGQPIPGTGFDFADFLLGYPQSSSIRYGSANTYFRSRIYSAWMQDEWRLRPNLTFNLGVRYEYYSPYYEKFGHLANLDVAPGFTGVAVATPDQPGPYTGLFPRGMVQPDPNNIAPRIGFAWRPRPKGKLLVRGGYSQFYDGSTYGSIAVRLAAQPPFASTGNISTSTQRRLTIDNGFALSGDAGKKITNTFAVARDYRVPYAQTWNLTLQRDFAQSFVVEAGYLGTKGTRLDVLRSPNRAAPGSPLTAEQRRLIGNAVGFTFDSSEGNSIFHAAQFRLTRRLRKGFSWHTMYTFAKSIDNASSVGGAGNVVAQNDKNLAAERGLSIFDTRHDLSATSLISSPFGDTAFWLREKSLLGKVLKDWNLSTTLSARAGRPFTARVLGNIADAGGTGAIGSGRADATGLSSAGGPGFFNPLAFTTPPPGRFGNAGRNTIRGPSFSALSASFGRTFNLGDRYKLEVRANSDNLTNHVSFTSIGTVVNATNYGLPTSASQMRTVSLTMRVRF